MKPDINLAHDVFRRARHPLDPFFEPRSVAVVGATEAPGSVGRTVLANLVATSFGGAVHPVNPRRDTVLGLRSYRSILEVPGPIDLAVVVTPAATVPDIIRQCGEAGVPAALIISAGFRETGAAGAELEAQVFKEARRHGMRIVGPNCLGIMSPASGLNATFAAGIARPGRVAFLSQSGALLTAILDWSVREAVGFSAFVSTGSMLDVGWGDLIDYFGDDAATRAIVIYMESIGDARAFLSAAREVALTKPIVVIKAGRSEAAEPRRHLAHGRADRIGRRAGRGVSARRRAARQRDRGGVRSGRDAGQATAAARPAPDHRDERGRSRRAGDGRPHRRRWRAGRAVGGRARPPRSGAARGVEPRQPDRRPGRRHPRSLRTGAGDRGG